MHYEKSTYATHMCLDWPILDCELIFFVKKLVNSIKSLAILPTRSMTNEHKYYSFTTDQECQTLTGFSPLLLFKETD